MTNVWLHIFLYAQKQTLLITGGQSVLTDILLQRGCIICSMENRWLNWRYYSWGERCLNWNIQYQVAVKNISVANLTSYKIKLKHLVTKSCINLNQSIISFSVTYLCCYKCLELRNRPRLPQTECKIRHCLIMTGTVQLAVKSVLLDFLDFLIFLLKCWIGDIQEWKGKGKKLRVKVRATESVIHADQGLICGEQQGAVLLYLNIQLFRSF